MSHDVVLNILEREFARGHRGEALYPIRDGQLFGCNILCHKEPPIHVRHKDRRQSNPAEAGIAKEL